MDCILSPARVNNEIILSLLKVAGVEISVRHDLPDGCTLFVCENGALTTIRPQLEDYSWVASKTKPSVEHLLSQAERGIPSVRMFGSLR